MYTEEYEQKGFPIKDFILKAVLVLIFVFLLVWLLPKFIAPIINKNTDKTTIILHNIFIPNPNPFFG